MKRPDQLDLFGKSRPELRRLEVSPGVYRADPDEVRAELLRVLAEAAQLRLAFETEIRRLDAA
jgi:hypothetical protein